MLAFILIVITLNGHFGIFHETYFKDWSSQR